MTESDEKKENQHKGKNDNPLVFISHDSRDAEIAEAFDKLLRSVSTGILKSFRSSDNKGTRGIEFGVEWYPKILERLQQSSDVVCILTEFSINRPWILFEAGMAKGKLDTPIYGVAIGVPLSSTNTGPFAQFQNCDYDVYSLAKLVRQLLNKLPNADPDEEVIQQQVQIFKDTSDSIIKKRLASSNSKKVSKQVKNTDIAVLFEEIKLMFQELKSRKETFSNITNNYEKYEEILKQVPDLEELISNNASPFSIRNLSKTMRNELLEIMEQTPDLGEKCKICMTQINTLVDRYDDL